ncbi:MAG: hypothetical protein NDI61_07745 [Bdellovibrionaceae bacterium]|nr:hypothetical protein [Pseudobdellovibrionaceae bacterium]
MKVLAFAAALIFSSSLAFAEETAAPAADMFNEMKTSFLSMLDERITNLNEAKTCVSSATNREEMKKCHSALKQDRMEMLEKMKAAREERRERRKEMREQRREEKNEHSGH